MGRISCTIITPVYNRAYTLERLYKSLQAQHNKDFEWIIIDDGSTEDNTGVITTFLKEIEFPVRYYKKENGGKHTAINCAMQYVRGDYTFIVDSDDYLPENSLARVLHWLEVSKQHDNIAGIGGLRVKIGTGDIIGTTFQGEQLICKSSERPRHGITGDKAEVFKTDILREYPFPEIPGEKFLSESIVWNAISEAGYDVLWFNEPIYCGEYLEDGLTSNLMKGYKQSPKGFAMYLKSLIHHEKVSKIREYYYYGMYKNVVGDVSTKDVANIFETSLIKVVLGDMIFKLKKVLN